jgi:hypothetical protein
VGTRLLTGEKEREDNLGEFGATSFSFIGFLALKPY